MSRTTYDDLEYHLRQFDNVYRSTEMMVDWLDKFIGQGANKNICDMACGCGANVAYLAARYPQCNFVGIDVEERLIEEGAKRLSAPNARLQQGDWFHLDESLRGKFDGVICFQTLSWLAEYKEPLKCLADLNPEWIAISSLFYEGDIDYFINVKDYTEDETNYKEMRYNVYSLERIRKVFESLGYKRFEYVPYEIDIDIAPPSKKGRGTYTKKLEDGKRIQIFGGMMMPWYFVIALK